MAEENNDGVSYLKALKRSGSDAGSAAAPARASDPGTQTGGSGSLQSAPGQHRGPEKRRSPRYKCEGSVEMRELSCEVHTWATFTDISLHGCYVEAQATYPVGTVLQIKLEASGVRVEATGNVRVSYPYLGMGIAFVNVTEENEARLRDMLASVSRPSVIMGPGIASSLPAPGPLESMPSIPDPTAAIQALVEFFESRQMLMRDDFLRILRRHQSTRPKL
jgi:hypothetical protein